MDDIQALLGDVLAHLPPGTNPYQAIDAVLVDTVSPARPFAFRVQLVVCMVVLGLCALFNLASIFVRISKGSFWLVHFRDQNPKLWRPHFTAGWTLWALVLVGTLEATLYKMVTEGDGLEADFGYFWTFAWIPAWMGGFAATWAICVSMFLHLHASGETALVETFAPWVNAGSIALPVAYVAAISPLAATCANRYERSIDGVNEIRAVLRSAAAAFDGRFDLVKLVPAYEVLDRVMGDFDEFQRWLRITFAYYAATATLLVVLMVTCSVLYLRALRGALAQAEDTVESAASASMQRKVMKKTVQNLSLTLICFTLIGSVFVGISLAIVIEPSFLTSSTAVQAVTLLVFWTFSIFGMSTSILLFVRSFDSFSPSFGKSLGSTESATNRSSRHVPQDSLSKVHRVQFWSVVRRQCDPTLAFRSHHPPRDDEINKSGGEGSPFPSGFELSYLPTSRPPQPFGRDSDSTQRDRSSKFTFDDGTETGLTISTSHDSPNRGKATCDQAEDEDEEAVRRGVPDSPPPFVFGHTPSVQ
ncbi:hypothetical protein JCM10212_005625 [Sporobolomyces blumeae]